VQRQPEPWSRIIAALASGSAATPTSAAALPRLAIGPSALRTFRDMSNTFCCSGDRSLNGDCNPAPISRARTPAPVQNLVHRLGSRASTSSWADRRRDSGPMIAFSWPERMRCIRTARLRFSSLMSSGMSSSVPSGRVTIIL
jgi:hypothetical protein